MRIIRNRESLGDRPSGTYQPKGDIEIPQVGPDLRSGITPPEFGPSVIICRGEDAEAAKLIMATMLPPRPVGPNEVACRRECLEAAELLALAMEDPGNAKDLLAEAAAHVKSARRHSTWWRNEIRSSKETTCPPTPAPSFDPEKPSLALLCKLGSALVHAEENRSDGGHMFDRIAFEGILKDPEVIAWRKAMGVYLPVTR